MIQTKYLNDGTLIQHYSDIGVYLIQNETGIKYADPVDIVPCPYSYTETDEVIEIDEVITETDEVIEIEQFAFSDQALERILAGQ